MLVLEYVVPVSTNLWILPFAAQLTSFVDTEPGNATNRLLMPSDTTITSRMI